MKRQSQILDAINSYIKRFGVCPTYDDITGIYGSIKYSRDDTIHLRNMADAGIINLKSNKIQSPNRINGDILENMSQDKVEIEYLNVSKNERVLIDEAARSLADSVEKLGQAGAREVIYAVMLWIHHRGKAQREIKNER